MNVYQIVSNLSYGDGVGNDILAIDDLLKKRGYHTRVFAIIVGERISKDVAGTCQEMPEFQEDDIVILHLAAGSDMNHWFKKYRCHKIIRYHNITPAVFFEPYSPESVTACRTGIKEVQELCRTPEYCIAVSQYNKKDLIRCGYEMEIDVVPVLIPFEDYAKKPDQKVMDRYQDGMTNLLFTGRIVPNKKQEDVILAFYYYQKYYNPDSRLFLVGSYRGMEKYYERLKAYADGLGVKNVVFTGHIGFSEILAYYHLADAFLCMSEHEGFCIPLLEAMYFEIPVIACDYAAIGGTMGGSGILLKEKDTLLAAGCVNAVVTNKTLREQIIKKQNERLKEFSPDIVREQFIGCLEKFISKKVKR